MRAGCTTTAPSLPLLLLLLIFALLKAADASAIPSSNGRLLSINLVVLNTSIAASGPSFEAASGDNSSCSSAILGNSVLQLLTSFEDVAPAQANFRADNTVLVGLYSIMLETWSPGGGAIANRHTLQGHSPASFFLRVVSSHSAGDQQPQRLKSEPLGARACPARAPPSHMFLAPDWFFVDVQWEFELPVCGGSLDLQFALSVHAFAVIADAVLPFNLSTGKLMARANHAAM
jgi:hypothetical protein